MTLFDLKEGQDLENRVAHTHQEFPELFPRPIQDYNHPDDHT